MLVLQVAGWLGSARALDPLTLGIGFVLVVATGACLWLRYWGWLLVSLVFFGLAAWSSVSSETLLGQLALPAHATRWCLPFLIWGISAKTLPADKCDAVGRYAVAATFAAHGLEALLFNPEFVALLEGSSRRLGRGGWSATTIEQTLSVIGLLDLAVAAALVFGPAKFRKGVLLYMCVWGLITALSRSVAHGFEGMAGTLLRSANWGIPLALLMRAAAARPRPDSEEHLG